MHELLNQLAARVSVLEEGHKALSVKVDENTKLTTAVKADTSAIVEFVSAYKTTKVVGSAMARIITFLAPLAALWFAYKDWRGH